MACSKEDIEHKRLAALEKKRSRMSLKGFNDSSVTSSHHKISNISPRSGFINQRYEPYTVDRTPKSMNASLFCNPKVVSGTIYLISDVRFEVKPSDYSEPLIAVFKSISSKNYDKDKRLWNFSLDSYEELLNKVTPLKPHVVLGPLPQYVLKVTREVDINQHIDVSIIESNLRNKLLPFQLEGVIFGLKKKGRCLIADDMGLGKTFQALAIAHYYQDDWPLLIVTTSSMRETWECKIHELLPSIPMVNVVSVSSGKEKQYIMDVQSRIIITSYKMSVLFNDILVQKKFGCVILDESHLLKSYKAQSTECVMKLTKKAKRVILLSGTPALSRPSELYTQLNIIDPNFFSNFTEYGKRYCAGKQTNYGWDMNGQSNLPELQIILTKKFLIRRTKDQVLDLKEKTRESVLLDSSLLRMTQEIQQGLSQLADSYKRKKSAEKHGALLTFFCETAKVKIPAICRYVSDVLSGNEKFIIFAHHRIVLEAICHTLDECRINYICIDGSTKSDYRTVLVDKFQFNESCRCAVLSITAANAGITLTAAQLVIFAELHWNPGILTQAEARAHRIGQQGGVAIKYLLAKGTADDFMWPMLENKLQVLNEVGLSKDTFGNTTLSKQETKENNITNYMVTTSKRNLIAGTNIEVNSVIPLQESNQKNDNNALDVSSFLEDEEGDELLANIHFQ